MDGAGDDQAAGAADFVALPELDDEPDEPDEPDEELDDESEEEDEDDADVSAGFDELSDDDPFADPSDPFADVRLSVR